MQLRSIFFLDTRLDHDLNALKKNVKQHLSDADLEPLGQSEKDLCRKFLKNATQIFDWAAIRMITKEPSFLP